MATNDGAIAASEVDHTAKLVYEEGECLHTCCHGSGGKEESKEVVTRKLWLLVTEQRRRSWKGRRDPRFPSVTTCSHNALNISEDFYPPVHLVAAAQLWWLESPSYSELNFPISVRIIKKKFF